MAEYSFHFKRLFCLFILAGSRHDQSAEVHVEHRRAAAHPTPNSGSSSFAAKPGSSSSTTGSSRISSGILPTFGQRQRRSGFVPAADARVLPSGPSELPSSPIRFSKLVSAELDAGNRFRSTSGRLSCLSLVS